jgi:hypothetical protein
MPAIQPISKSRPQIHIDIFDQPIRQLWAERLDVTEPQLGKAVHLIGRRISTGADHLGKRVE